MENNKKGETSRNKLWQNADLILGEEENKVQGNTEIEKVKKSSPAKDYVHSNSKTSKKRKVQNGEETELPSKLKFLQKEVPLTDKRSILINSEIHSKLKYASKIMDVDMQQFACNILDNFFEKHGDDLQKYFYSKVKF